MKSGAAPIRPPFAAALMGVLLFLVSGSVWSEGRLTFSGAPWRMFFGEGLGFEAETGRPGAIVAREVLTACEGRLSGQADFSSALGVVEGTDSSLVDSAGLHAVYAFLRFRRTELSADAFVRYRFLFVDASEFRFGGLLRGRWGAGFRERGLYGDWALGFEDIRTAIRYIPDPLWEGNPLLRVALGWRFSRLWSADASIASFSDEDATYFFRTLFDFGANLRMESFALRAHLVLKYSDFFTPTGYLDGLAFRLAATIPIRP
ncbi:MAG: hypothetical protein M0Z80_13840 [Treponema sp.]|nr:hypothetical protein [Treponema sp.]